MNRAQGTAELISKIDRPDLVAGLRVAIPGTSGTLARIWPPNRWRSHPRRRGQLQL
jgi:hypothetical protein